MILKCDYTRSYRFSQSVMSELRGGHLFFTEVLMQCSIILKCMTHFAILCNFKVYYVNLYGLKWMISVKEIVPSISCLEWDRETCNYYSWRLSWRHKHRHTDFKLLQSRALRVPFHSMEIRRTMSKYRQPGIKANEAPTYPLSQGNECT